MGRNVQLLKLFFAIFGSTAIIFSSAYFGPKAVGVDKEAALTAASFSKTAVQNGKNPVDAKTAETKAEIPAVISNASIRAWQLPAAAQILIKNHPKIKLEAKSTFSLLGFLKKENLEHEVSSEALSMIGSLIYQTILPTNFTVEERNISSHLPAFAKIGYETKVSADQNLDLSFYNSNSTSYTLEFQLTQGVLSAVLMGAPLAEQYKIRISEVQTYKPKTIVQYSPLLEQGKKKIAVAGENGRMVRLYRDTYQNDVQTKSKLVAEDYYAPVYRIEIHSLLTPASSSSLAATDPAATGQPANAPEGQKQQLGSEQPRAVENGSQADSAYQASSSNTNASDLFGKPAEQPK